MTAPQARPFSAGQVMTVLAGSSERAFCTGGQLLDVLGWLLQDMPAHDQIDGAIERARGGVQRQHPDLVPYVAPPEDASDSHVLGWLADIENRHGFEFELVPVVERPAVEEADPDV